MHPTILRKYDYDLLEEIDNASSLNEYLFVIREFDISENDFQEFLVEEQNRISEESKIIYPTWEEVLAANGMGGIWEEELAKKKRPQDLPKGTFHLDLHFRGASVHKDFRRKMNQHLQGWTITDQVEGAITEKIKNLADARKWKWNDKKLFKFQPDMGDENIKCVAIKKADQPLVWMGVRNVVFPPGSVGATRFEPGVFLPLDEGLSDEGTQKSYFEEYFLYGKHFKGRLVIRLIPVRKKWRKKPKEKLQWQCWMTSSDPESQLPYLLTPRGRKKRDAVPPDGESWIWKEWKRKIPKELQWWLGAPSRETKFNMIDKSYDYLIDKGFLKFRKLKPIRKSVNIPIQFADNDKFILRYCSWRGQFVVRGIPVDHWDIVLDKGAKCLDEFAGMKDNPLHHPEGVPCIRHDCCIGTPEGKPNKEWMKFSGDILPNHPEWGNPNKRIKAKMEIRDSGRVNIINDKETFFSAEFFGKELKGYWIAKRESKKGEIWVFSKSQFPGEKRIS